MNTIRPLILTLLFSSCICAESKPIRFATFNTALNRNRAGELIDDLKTGENDQARKIAEIIQRVRPSVLLINEFDYDERHEAAALFDNNYLQVGQRGQKPIHYKHRFLAAVNTGVDSGKDLNGDGKTGGPADAFGFGKFPGQYGMVVFSELPIKTEALRTFHKFLWADMPSADLPTDPKTKRAFYNDDVLDVFRLSSKSHWDLPIVVGDEVVHFLVCHPTPPVFDGPEDRNGRRNRDEIRFWADYIDPLASKFIYDDQGKCGGLSPGAKFVVAGDLNADPVDGESSGDTAQLLTKNLKINTAKTPSSLGGVEQSTLQGKINARHKGNPAHDTCDFNDFSVGNLRVDYVLPSDNLTIVDAGVFWPKKNATGFDLVDASDHRLVWIDVRLASE